jgi:hypothetical protein
VEDPPGEDARRIVEKEVPSDQQQEGRNDEGIQGDPRARTRFCDQSTYRGSA